MINYYTVLFRSEFYGIFLIKYKNLIHINNHKEGKREKLNLIDAVVKNVLDKREFNSTLEWDLNSNDVLYNIDFVEFECFTEDMGGSQVELLVYRRFECPYVKVGYVFQH